MINLKKVFRRKKAQGALEYLFMIAAALIIIFVVVRYISQSGGQASQQGDIAALQSQAELAKSTLEAKGLWEGNETLQNWYESCINNNDETACENLINAASGSGGGGEEQGGQEEEQSSGSST